MSRPRKDQQEPCATERMEDAFWLLLKQKPFVKITVSDIIREANVNRNTFYYHYKDTSDLASRAVKGLLLADGPYIVARVIATNGEYLNEVLNNNEVNKMFSRVSLIATPHSTPELTNMLKRSFVEIWFRSFQVDEDKLDPAAQIALTFTAGGLVEVLGTWGQNLSSISPQTILESGLANTVASMLSSTLAPASANPDDINALLSGSPTRLSAQSSARSSAQDLAR